MNAQTDSLESMRQPVGGLFQRQVRFRAMADEPSLVTRVERLGNVGQIWAHVGRTRRGPNVRDSVEGAGVGLNDEEASVRAAAEALERYCACVFTEDQFIRASANELGSSALDLDTIPRCSAKELSDPLCPLMPPDKASPIRWVAGISLLDGRTVYLPAVMVYLYAGMECLGERFWFPISTGCAAHTTLESALVAGILEVIERDALTILWLQQLALPRIEVDGVPSGLAPYWERYQRGSRKLEYIFFDATTDLGVPTIYGVQLSPANRAVSTLVSCSTSLNPVEALVGAIREMSAGRIAFRQTRSAPDNVENFSEIFHGATHMARAEQAGAFSFLLDSGSTRALSELKSLAGEDIKLNLQLLLDRFRERHFEVYAVDLSTDEALRAGMRVVRIVIPALQPLSFQHRARYLGHPRLYQAPKLMGFPVRGEAQLNRWPQPFA